MTIDEETYRELCEENAGYCTACDEITEESGVEPDARQYPCSECGQRTVYGIEEALVMGWIEIGGDDE